VEAAPERVASQSDITGNMAAIAADYQHGGRGESQPRLDYPPYRSSRLRHPTFPAVVVDPEEIELWAPGFGHQDVDAGDADLTAGHPGQPIGERIVVSGRVLDASGRPLRAS
jgi:protocatechuate 3,4-dioxygenase, beta subunit